MPRVFLTDFGLAADTATGSRFTRTGTTLGTPNYMSPEQARGEVGSLTPAADVWGLGCVLYELLAGERAFQGETPAAVIGDVMTVTPTRPEAATVAVWQLVRACLEREAADRPPTAQAVQADCARLVAGQSPLARPRRELGRPLVLAGVGLLAVLAAIAAVWRPDADVAELQTPKADPTVGLLVQVDRLHRTNPRQAATLLRRVLEQRPDHHGARLRLGELQWSLDDYQAAEQTWGQIPESAPESTRALWLRGLLAYVGPYALGGANRRAEAEALWRRAAEGQGDPAAWARAGLLVIGGHWDQARELLGQPDDWTAALLRGQVEGAHDSMEVMSDAPARIAAYTRAIESGPPMGWVFNNRGVLLHHEGNPEAARRDLDRAVQLMPNAYRPWANRALARRACGDLDGAETDYARALELAPEQAVIWFNRSNVRLDRGDATGALADLNEAIRLDPESAEAWGARAGVRRVMGDLEGAREDCDRSIALKPRATVLHTRGLLRWDTGDVAGARADFDQALALRPNAPTFSDRARLRELAGDFDGAFADFTEALRLEPDNAETYVARAVWYERRKDRDSALADLRQALVVDPKHFNALGLLGMLQMRSGDWAAAAEVLRRFLAHAPPDHRMRPSAQRWLAEADQHLREDGR